MIRKTLTILSLFGLLLSVGLWVASYWEVGLTLSSGFTMRAADGLLHIGRERPLGGGSGWRMTLAIWPAPLVFALAMTLIIGRPLHRRRKRKKLGLCVKCGYDLRGSEDRCPECGTEFEHPVG